MSSIGPIRLGLTEEIYWARHDLDVPLLETCNQPASDIHVLV